MQGYLYMTSKKIVLNDNPQLIATGECYIQSRNGEFKWVYSDGVPTDLTVYYTDSSLYSSGSFGSIYAWENLDNVNVTLIVTDKG